MFTLNSTDSTVFYKIHTSLIYVIYANMLIYLIEHKKNIKRGKYGKNLDTNACCGDKS